MNASDVGHATLFHAQGGGCGKDCKADQQMKAVPATLVKNTDEFIGDRYVQEKPTWAEHYLLNYKKVWPHDVSMA